MALLRVSKKRAGMPDFLNVLILAGTGTRALIKKRLLCYKLFLHDEYFKRTKITNKLLNIEAKVLNTTHFEVIS